MKNLLSLGMMALLIATSCKDQPKEAEVETTVDKTSSTKVEADFKNCYDEESIMTETALLWFNSWAYAAGGVTGGDFPDSPDLIFSKVNIDKMEPDLKTNKGALIYYILRDPVTTSSSDEDKVPSLAMIRTDKCQPVFDECGDHCALVSWLDTGEQKFITQNEINEGLLDNYRYNWTTYLNTIGKARVKIDGYFYPWTLIDFLLEKSSLQEKNKGIVIKYGVRTLGPGEIHEFVKDPAPDEVVGSPVLCNVIFPKEDNQTTADAFNAHAMGDEGFDFAKPCPTYCD